MTIDLTLSVGEMDTVLSLLTGEVDPDGIDLTTVSEYPPTRHRRFARHQEFDAAEICLATYVSTLEQPEKYPFTAIPVFPNRKFRHAFLYKNAHTDVAEPKDLEGKTIGTQSWATTADVWLRGILQDHYDLDLTEVTWYRRREDEVVDSLPETFDIRQVPGEQGGDALEVPRDMQGMLFSGDLDAAMDPSGDLFYAVARSDDAEFLFEDPMAEATSFYEETGIHPPMHTVAIRDEILEEHPWVAVSLYRAFSEALDNAISRNRSPSTHTSLTFNHLHYRAQHDLLGEDAWEYGLTPKTHNELSTFLDYARDQGLTDQKHDVEDLFFETTLDL
jgi:4,5-dihydroxyphthalate decarboxylase